MKQIPQRCTAMLTAALLVLTGIAAMFLPMNQRFISAEAASGSMSTLEIGTVQIDMDQLKQDHYLVTVPVTFPSNPGFEILQCGVSWDKERMSALGAKRSSYQTTPLFSYSPNNDFMWATYVGSFSGTELYTVTFQLNEDVQVGDFLEIKGVSEDYNHNPAQYADASLNHIQVDYINGGISIVDNIIPEVTLEIGDEGVAKASMQDLEENHYIVEVPIRAISNNGFSGLQFGVSWDNTQLIAEAPSGNTPDGLSLMPSFDNSSGTGWVQVFADARYAGTDICTLRFRVPDDAKPASSYEISLTVTGSGGEANVTNSDGKEGTLTLCTGTIRITSTQPVNSYANGIVSLPDIEVTPEELEANDYILNIPVCISQNSAFTQLEFGVSWDTNDLNILNCTCDDKKNLGMIATDYGIGGGIWLPFLYRGKNGAYVGTSLCTISFRVRPDAGPGDVFTLTADETDGEGSAAMIANLKGEAGKIRLSSGSISIVSTERQEAAASVKIGDVEITMDQLEYDDYQVKIPLTLTKNAGIASVAFGISWDSSLALAMDATSFNQEYLGLQSNFYTEQDMVWLNYISIDPDENYVYYDLNLGTLVLELSEDVQPGDVIPLTASNLSKSGTAASTVDADGDSAIPILESGSIRIIDDSVTTAEATETTPPTVTTTTTTPSVTESSASVSSSETITSSESTTTTTETSTQTAAETATTTSRTRVTTTTVSATTQQQTTTQNTGDHLEQQDLTIAVGKTVSLSFFAQNGDISQCVWLSDNPSIASVTVGNTSGNITITGKSPGTTLVMVLYEGQVYTCTVTVVAADDSFGDINLDKVMDLSDLVLLNKCIAGSLGELSAEAMDNADINQDSYIDCKDAFLLLQQLVETGLIEA